MSVWIHMLPSRIFQSLPSGLKLPTSYQEDHPSTWTLRLSGESRMGSREAAWARLNWRHYRILAWSTTGWTISSGPSIQAPMRAIGWNIKKIFEDIDCLRPLNYHWILCGINDVITAIMATNHLNMLWYISLRSNFIFNDITIMIWKGSQCSENYLLAFWDSSFQEVNVQNIYS